MATHHISKALYADLRTCVVHSRLVHEYQRYEASEVIDAIVIDQNVSCVPRYFAYHINATTGECSDTDAARHVTEARVSVETLYGPALHYFALVQYLQLCTVLNSSKHTCT